MRHDEDLDLIRVQKAPLLQEQVGEEHAVANETGCLYSQLSRLYSTAGFYYRLFGVNVGGMPGIDNRFALATLCAGTLVLCLTGISGAKSGYMMMLPSIQYCTGITTKRIRSHTRTWIDLLPE
jgi:hypothetical protein